MFCAHINYLCYTEWMFYWYKKLLYGGPKCCYFSKMTHLWKSYLLISVNKTKSFLWNTKNTVRNSVNEQNTYTTHREKGNTRKVWLLLVCDTSSDSSLHPYFTNSSLFLAKFWTPFLNTPVLSSKDGSI